MRIWQVGLFVAILVSLATSAFSDGKYIQYLLTHPWPNQSYALPRSGEVMGIAPCAIRGTTAIWHLKKSVPVTFPAGSVFYGTVGAGMFNARVFVALNKSNISKRGCGNPSTACWPVSKPAVQAQPVSQPVAVEVSIRETRIVTLPAPLPLLSFGSGGRLALPNPNIPVGWATASQRQAAVSVWASWLRSQRQVAKTTPAPVVPGTCPPVTPGTAPHEPTPGSGAIETPNPQAGIGWPGAPVAPGAPPPSFPPPVIGGGGSVTPLPPGNG